MGQGQAFFKVDAQQKATAVGSSTESFIVDAKMLAMLVWC